MASLYSPFVPTRGCICDPVISHGHSFSRFFGEWIGVCLWTPFDTIGYVLGLINLIVTAFIQGPQLILNFKRKDCSGVSRNMLLLWVSGDFSGFLGLLLTSQIHSTAFFQQILGLAIDLTLLIQWFIYNRNKKEGEGGEEEEGDVTTDDNNNNDESTSQTAKKSTKTDDLNEPLLSSDDIDSESSTTIISNHGSAGHGVNTIGNNNNGSHRITMYLAVIITIISGISPTNGRQSLSLSSSSSALSSLAGSIGMVKPTNEEVFKGDVLTQNHHSFISSFSPSSQFISNGPQSQADPTPVLCETPIPEPSRTQEVIGYFFAVICGLIYTPSLTFQVIHNYNLKDATGMSIHSIIINIVAYTLYFFAVLLPDKTRDWHQFGVKFWLGVFPYVGSFFISCCCLCIILFQKWLYLDNVKEEEHEEEDGEERDEDDIGSDQQLVELPLQTNSINI